jgi:hypothetical protein
MKVLGIELPHGLTSFLMRAKSDCQPIVSPPLIQDVNVTTEVGVMDINSFKITGCQCYKYLLSRYHGPSRTVTCF